MKLWAHTLVKNEERYLWFAVTSVIEYVDKMLLWDTGSTDNTLLVIKELQKKYRDKINFREVGEVGIEQFTKVRQQMLDSTSADWFIIVDGDEVWWEESIKKIREIINDRGLEIETIVNRYYNLVGDVYHYQDEAAGRYRIDGVTGHITIRAINNKIPGLNFSKPHGQQGIFDGRGTLIQDRDVSKRLFIDEQTYLHFTHLVRSSNLESDKKIIKRDIKFKYELGNRFPNDFYYPESLLYYYPEIIACPWVKSGLDFMGRAVVETPLRKIKRMLPSNSSGY